MKLDLIEIIRIGEIIPLFWGCSVKEIIELFPESELIINDLKDREYPFIILDDVEFYFEEDGYKDLSEIVVKNWCYTKDYESQFFDIGWLNASLAYEQTLQKLDKLSWDFDSYPDVKSIATSKNVSLVFDEMSEDELQKIYIKRENNILPKTS
jgi:hypothetical protein